jgi:hypothetical protein
VDLNRRLVALVAAALLATLVGPPGMALAGGGEIASAGPIEVAHDASPDDEDAEDSSEDVRDHGDPSDEGNRSSDSDKGSCTSVSSLAVCSDQPRS